MPRPEMDLVALQIAGREERQAADMVEMGVAVEEIGVDRAALLHQLVAELPEARSAVEDQEALAAAHLDAGRVAAIADGFGPGAGDAAADAPEAHQDIARRGHLLPSRKAVSLPCHLPTLVAAAPSREKARSFLYMRFHGTRR